MKCLSVHTLKIKSTALTGKKCAMVKVGQNLSHWFYIYANNLKNLQNSDLILGIQLNLALIKLYPWKKISSFNNSHVNRVNIFPAFWQSALCFGQ